MTSDLALLARIERALRAIPTERWSEEAWRRIKGKFPKVLAE